MADAEKGSTSFVQDNWAAYVAGKPLQTTIEVSLYTDVRLTGGDAVLGPMVLINTLAWAGREGDVAPSILARIGIHVDQKPAGTLIKDDFQHYHGGDQFDELAAIVAVALGARVWAGTIERSFDPEEDRFGKLYRYRDKSLPAFQRRDEKAAQIPSLGGERSMEALAALSDWSQRPNGHMSALIKAARQYQQAVWTADSDPELCWLLLIAAIETVSVKWATDAVTPEDMLKDGMPELHSLLQTKSPAVLSEVANLLRNLTGSTKRFRDFLAHFAPGPPDHRPEPWLQFDYSNDNIRKAASKIYHHRSRALHDGIAFPAPMCGVPRAFGALSANDAALGKRSPLQEIPIGLATSSMGATWKHEQTPMVLSTFERIARQAILNWWSSTQAMTGTSHVPS
jgi:hypothetical protein